MNRLKKEIIKEPRQSKKIDELRKFVDSKGWDRTKQGTGIDGNGVYASRERLYHAIMNNCNLKNKYMK